MGILSLDQVSKRFGAIKAVSDVSFSVGRGEVVGFLGPNGAGKSTTMRIITQYLDPDEGTVLFDGAPIGKDREAVKRRIGYLAENNPLYQEMLVVEYLEYLAKLRQLPRQAREEALDEAVDCTSIGPVYYRPISELSKGFRQRVGLAAAILHKPDLLVLDEPTEGLDPNQRVEIRNLIAELGRERTVLLSTHVLSEVEQTCSRLLIIHRGSLVADGPVEALLLRATGDARITLEVAGSNVETALGNLAGVVGCYVTATLGDRVTVELTVRGTIDRRPEIFQLAVERGWTVYELHQVTASLEDVFRELTSRGYLQ